MTKITVTSSNQTIEFDAVHFAGASDIDNLIVTVIDPVSDSIIDHCFESLKLSRDSDGSVCYSSQNPSKEIGIFPLVAFINHEKDTFMGIFEEYDGKILAYNEKPILTTNRKLINQGVLKEKIYVVTGYNDGEIKHD